ncbi:1-deoxy-D-xylulose-5-phosphate reductoisomerase [Sciscionella marina]|uniref:1-deoxy-D-xylulose-5-phosphate reductoisomerase n=1 Tax=Sciscionella marina TaxID=508770 RepID=UPI00035C2F70|nr:1-deoxy-D-xylulose-5-phosphate reductoisomerase [Sciscionella marina]
MDPRSVVLLGSTGSIGTQVLEVVAANPDRFRVLGLSAGGANPELLAEQVLATGAQVVAIGKPTAAEDLTLALYAAAERAGYARGEFAMPRILVGAQAPVELIEQVPADVIVNGITGSVGLAPTMAALATGSRLALANKESLVAGGPLVTGAAKPGQIVPVDSEHSALTQCLRSGAREEVAKLVVTASGGPFRGRTREQMRDVTVEQALAHPTWNMGKVITINSATLVNKGLEVIEAHLLYDIPYERIDVVVHPQSIVHSMVTFTDGATIAQASPPDMRLPIALALGWPQRVPDAAPSCDFGTASSWEFEPLDEQVFPSVPLAKAAGETGGCVPAVFNAANERALDGFVTGYAAFTDIVDTVTRVVEDADQWRGEPSSVEEVLAAEHWARERCGQYLARSN